jgi:hypothetical protein
MWQTKPLRGDPAEEKYSIGLQNERYRNEAYQQRLGKNSLRLQPKQDENRGYQAKDRDGLDGR